MWTGPRPCEDTEQGALCERGKKLGKEPPSPQLGLLASRAAGNNRLLLAGDDQGDACMDSSCPRPSCLLCLFPPPTSSSSGLVWGPHLGCFEATHGVSQETRCGPWNQPRSWGSPMLGQRPPLSTLVFVARRGSGRSAALLGSSGAERRSSLAFDGRLLGRVPCGQ